MGRLLSPEEAEEFRDIIARYRPNDEVLEQFRSSNFFVIAGPTGSGKDTLRDSLIVRHPKIYASILSTVTRPIRPGESEGAPIAFGMWRGLRRGLSGVSFFK